MAIRIALVPHLTELSGAPLTHFEYARRLAALDDFEVVFIVPDEGPLTRRARVVGLRVEVVANPAGGLAEKKGLAAKLGHLWRRREARDALAEFLTAHRPDVVFASSVVNVLPASAARAAGLKLVYHLQEPAFSFPDTPANRQKAKLIGEAASFLFTAPGSHTAMFEAVRQVPVHNAVDLLLYDRARRAACRAKLLAEFRMPADAEVVTCVASISRRKGLDALWEGSYDLFFRHPKLHILAVGPDGGDAEFAAHLRAQVAESDFADRFIFTGPRDDIPDILLGTDIFVLPTQADAQPLAVIEAMAAGLPIVTTDVGDIPPMLLEGEIGFILPAADPQSFQVGIEKILDVPEVKQRYEAGVLSRARDFSYDAALEIVARELRALAAS